MLKKGSMPIPFLVLALLAADAPETPAALEPASEPASAPVEDKPGFDDGFQQSLSLGPFEISGRGFIQNDLRFVIISRNRLEPLGSYVRNETQIMGRLNVSIGEHVKAVAQARPLFTGIAKTSEFSDLLDRTKVDPFWIELDDAYVELTNIAPGLDLKLGRQTAVWGTGDLFNPTNVLNGRDFYDPLLFGRPISNQMILARYQTPIDLSFTAIYIPVFRPARLPTTAPAAFDGGAPVVDPKDAKALADLRDFQNNVEQNFGFPIVNTIVPVPKTPPVTIQNGMAAGKIKASFLNIDASLSYAYAFWDLPVAKAGTVSTVQTRTDSTALLPSRVDSVTTIELTYPRFHMIGLDFSTSIEPLGGLGFWGEIGLFIPERAVNFAINYGSDDDKTLLTSLYGKALPCDEAKPCPTLRATPFVKATVGLDYTFTKWLYANAQYLYGFVDEFGAGTLNHYVVANVDIKPFGEDYTLRLASAIQLQPPNGPVGASAVAFPALILKPFPGLEMYLGGIFFLAKNSTDKFGRPENGSTQIFLRVRFSF